MRSPFLVLYLVLGVLVAAGVISSDPNLFSGLDTIEEFVELILTILLWPLVLLGIDFHIGDIDVGGGDGASSDGGTASGSSSSSGGK